MAHFAQVDQTGIVRQIIVIDNKDMLDSKGKESEKVGQDFIASIGLEGIWIQTSYNGNFRGKYAAVGDTWDGTKFVSSSVYAK